MTPIKDPKHRATRQSTVSKWSENMQCTQGTPTHKITMHSHAIASKWPLRSSHHTGHISSTYNVQLYSRLSHQTPSSHQYSPGLALPTIASRQMHKYGPNLAGSYQNYTIQSALASLRGLLSQKIFFIDFYTTLKYNCTTRIERAHPSMHIWKWRTTQPSVQGV